MFNCDSCKTSVGPSVSPLRVINEVRTKIYDDEKGNFVGRGSEIVRESVICPPCYGITPVGEPIPDPNPSIQLPDERGFLKHARGCKKSPFDCKICGAQMSFYANLPLAILSRLLN